MVALMCKKQAFWDNSQQSSLLHIKQNIWQNSESSQSESSILKRMTFRKYMTTG